MRFHVEVNTDGNGWMRASFSFTRRADALGYAMAIANGREYRVVAK